MARLRKDRVPCESLMLLCLCCLLGLCSTLVVGIPDVATAKQTTEQQQQTHQQHEEIDRSAETSAEILQLPHPLRHQERHRPRHMQQLLQQLKERDKNISYDTMTNVEMTTTAPMPADTLTVAYDTDGNGNVDADATTDDAGDDVDDDNNDTNGKNHQSMLDQLSPDDSWQLLPHHHRHEKHLLFKHLMQQKQQQHRLRHRNRYHTQSWEQLILPERHQHIETTTSNNDFPVTMTPTRTKSEIDNELDEATDSVKNAKNEDDNESNGDMLSSNVYNRISNNTSNSNNFTYKTARFFDRDGLFSNTANKWNRMLATRGPKFRHSNAHERAFGDDARTYVDAFGKTGAKTDEAQRISLKLSPTFEENNDFDEENVASSGSESVDDNEDSVADDDDFSYEDSVEDAQLLRNNEYPGSSGAASSRKTAVKRFTNPFKSYKTATRHLDFFAQAQQDVYGSNYLNGLRSAHERDDSQDSERASANDNDNTSPDFSSEKWNKIEHEHHLKQLQHQREIQALLRNKPTVTNVSGNKSPEPFTPKSTSGNYKDNDLNDNTYGRYYMPGSLTRQKQDELGTVEAVQKSHGSHSVRHKHNKALANAHVRRMNNEAACRVPQRRVEHIQKDPSKIYTPHCTVLHRCADDTGCCRSQRQTCAPKHTETIDLYFFAKSINDKRGAIERLTFINHTECHCVDKSPQRAAEFHHDGYYYGGNRERGMQNVIHRATIFNCNCPRLYEKILQEDGYCRCDCSSGNTGCDWLKRGMEHFSMIDRKCIMDGHCKSPTCEYGSYIKKHGRCPRREEQLTSVIGGESSVFSLSTNALHAHSYR